eukprot:GDKI01027682.1.p1 GENE.GDKI01027682.1~~GDKI01027682.1.p1  ORF type:complete len:329 (+),score=125.95 GDKI01027682.1:124-1110(+)
MRRIHLLACLALCAPLLLGTPSNAAVVTYASCQRSLSSTGLGVMASQALDDIKTSSAPDGCSDSSDATCLATKGLANRDVCDFFGGAVGAECCAYYKQLTGDAAAAVTHYKAFCDKCVAQKEASDRAQCVDFLAYEGTTFPTITLCADPKTCTGQTGDAKTTCQVNDLLDCIATGKKGTAGVCALLNGRGRELGCCELTGTDKMSRQIKESCTQCTTQYKATWDEQAAKADALKDAEEAAKAAAEAANASSTPAPATTNPDTPSEPGNDEGVSEEGGDDKADDSDVSEAGGDDKAVGDGSGDDGKSNTGSAATTAVSVFALVAAACAM